MGAQAWVELPRDYGWGPTRVLHTELGRQGYAATEIRFADRIYLAVNGSRPDRAAEMRLLKGPGGQLKIPAGVTEGLPDTPYQIVPVLPALRPVLPAGGLPKGAVVGVDEPGLLTLALAAGASREGMYVGAAGLPDLGVVAAAGCGIEPGRLMLVPDPGPRWPEVTRILLEACEVVLLRPPVSPPAAVRRQLEKTMSRSGSVLVVAGPWEGAAVRLRVTSQAWAGIGDGYGRLRARRVQVVSDGRGAAARPRRTWLWLPGPDGSVTAAQPPAAAAEPDWRQVPVIGATAL